MRRRSKAPSTASAHAAESTVVVGRRARGLFGLACLCVLGLVAFLGTGAPSVGAAEQFPGQGFLPDGRAWEMVSPPEKNGGEITPESRRTRAASDGEAIEFMSLGGFGDAQGASVATEYIAQRSTDPDPGDSGWSTHGITPPQAPIPLNVLTSDIEPQYTGEFSEDLNAGVFFAFSPLTDEPNVADVANLYRRTDLLSPGAGSYELLTAASAKLPPLPLLGANSQFMRPLLSWASADLGHVTFESKLSLTADAPAPPSGCSLEAVTLRCRSRVYEWDNGTVRLAGRIPTPAIPPARPAASCDDAGGPACVIADGSIPGQGPGLGHAPFATPHTISDGSDGHSRIFFTQPTDTASKTSSQVPVGSQQNTINQAPQGRLFMRLDATSTEQLNASERTDCAGPLVFPPVPDPTCGGDGEPDPAPGSLARAAFQDASEDGTRAFFITSEPLTDDAPSTGATQLYMYDASKPGSAPDNLTLLSVDEEPSGTKDSAQGVIGAGEDGSHVYFLANGEGQLVAGGPLTAGPGVFLWHEGEISFIGRTSSGPSLQENQATGAAISFNPKQARVSPDGSQLLFSSITGDGVLSAKGGTDYDHGSCVSDGGEGCRELYLYSADADTLQCASCNPSGAAATAMARTAVRENNGGAGSDTHLNRAISSDGSYAFFSSAEKLVPGDTNGVSDAYLYETASGEPHLLSSGEDASPSYFLDASVDGKDAFFVTRERLSGWDVDGAYDLYDARVGGGFPEPTFLPGCQGDACQPAPPDLNDPTPSSSTFRGEGNRHAGPTARRCPKGKRRVRVRSGKTRCVRRQGQPNKKRAANNDRRASR